MNENTTVVFCMVHVDPKDKSVVISVPDYNFSVNSDTFLTARVHATKILKLLNETGYTPTCCVQTDELNDNLSDNEFISCLVI